MVGYNFVASLLVYAHNYLKEFHCYIYGVYRSLAEVFYFYFSLFIVLLGGFLDLIVFHGYVLNSLVIELISIVQSL